MARDSTELSSISNEIKDADDCGDDSVVAMTSNIKNPYDYLIIANTYAR